jgi:hypothetical protein
MVGLTSARRLAARILHEAVTVRTSLMSLLLTIALVSLTKLLCALSIFSCLFFLDLALRFLHMLLIRMSNMIFV